MLLIRECFTSTWSRAIGNGQSAGDFVVIGSGHKPNDQGGTVRVFNFSRAEAPTSDSLEGCFQPRLSAGEIAMARRFNENQAAMAREALDQQVELAQAMMQKYNDSIRDLIRRVASVLNEACSARIQPDPESGRRWLASTLGTAYKSAADSPKPTTTDIVSPLYNPTFLPIPVAT
jgi:hypothetical protein